MTRPRWSLYVLLLCYAPRGVLKMFPLRWRQAQVRKLFMR